MLDWFSQRENITVTISVASFILSLVSIALQYFRGLERYKLSVVDYAVRYDVLTVFFSLENRSANPLVIVNVSVLETTCELLPKLVRKILNGQEALTTPMFPVCVPAHGCSYFFLEFHIDRSQQKLLVPGTKVNFQIHTTRRVTKRNLRLPSQQLCYLHKKSQLQNQ